VNSHAAAGCATCIVGVLHVVAIAGLVAALAPVPGPAAARGGALEVWLLPVPAVARPDGRPGYLPGVPPPRLCSMTVEIDEHGVVWDNGPPSPAFLRSLPAGSDGHFPRVALLCTGLRPWPKRWARPPGAQGGQVLPDAVILVD